jgi:ketosteroid isomerase-like protein
MSHPLELKVRSMFEALDRLDMQTIFADLSDDIETVDELTQKWNRGRAAAEAAFNMAGSSVSEVKSELSEFNVLDSGDMAVVTCLLNQSYVYEGTKVHIVAPTSCVARLENGEWKFVLLHSIPFA